MILEIAGKKMKQRVTEVSFHMQSIPLSLFGSGEVCEHVDPNVLTLRIQPEEGIDAGGGKVKCRPEPRTTPGRALPCLGYGRRSKPDVECLWRGIGRPR